ncbi:MAG: YbaN family protein [Alphaproteobacteria bacterium]|nr:YbaN family protein [Alphaproteobacteria bacterium]
MEDRTVNEPETQAYVCRPARYGMLAVGWSCVALGLIGLLVPLMPTTVFLLIALWAFSKSSIRFHSWLYSHPRLGRALRDWHQHRIIPTRAKVLALAMIGASAIAIGATVAESWQLAAAVLPLGLVAGWIATRPSRAPQHAES